jgi:hypothetical protein
MTSSGEDPFAALAEEQIAAPRKARLRAAETRAERARQKELEDRNTLFRFWQKHQHQHVQALLQGPHGAAAHELVGQLKHLTLESGSDLIALVRRGPWRTVDADTRFLVLRLIDSALAQLRERHGLPPFDDALLPEEPLTVFQIIRAELAND